MAENDAVEELDRLTPEEIKALEAEVERITKTNKAYFKRYNAEVTKDVNTMLAKQFEELTDMVPEVAKKLEHEKLMKRIIQKETLDDLEELSRIAAYMFVVGCVPKKLHNDFRRVMKIALKNSAADAFMAGCAAGVEMGKLELTSQMAKLMIEKTMNEAEVSETLQ